MAKVDVSRFGDKLLKIFAPSILKGQVFIAFTDEDTNSFTIQGDNLSSNSSDYELDELEQKLQTRIDSVQDSIPKIPEIPEGVTLEDINDLLDTLEQRLQAKIDTLQNSGTEQQASFQSSITIVDDIVYGYHNTYGDSPKIHINDEKQLRGRPILFQGEGFFLSINPYLTTEIYNYNNSIKFLDYGTPAVYAGFGDGKIHTIDNFDDDEYGIVSTNINNGDFIMNKADHCIYSYDAANHKFIRVGGKQRYVVDYIVDYIGEGIPKSLTANDIWAVDLSEIGNTLPNHLDIPLYYWHQRILWDIIAFPKGTCFANIQSVLSDDAAIYIVDTFNSTCIRVIHDLFDGDTVYNKADGYTYTFSDDGTSQSFIRSSTPVIQPVLDIVSIGEDRPDKPSAEGEKFLQFYPPESWWTLLYTATSQDTWDNGVDIQVGDRYASLTDHKIYEFKNGFWADIDAFYYDAPVGVPFLNKADNCLYFYNGSDFVKINAT